MNKLSCKELRDKGNELGIIVYGQTWSLALKFLYKSKPVTRTTLTKSEEVFILTKDEHKNLINLKLKQGKVTQLSLNFDSFVGSILKVKLIRLNKCKWSDSKFSCGFYMKNYFCYHVIALAVNEKLLEIPNEYKNIAIGAKPKRGRKKKTDVGGLRRQPIY